MKGLDKVSKFAKGVLGGTKAEIVVNSLDDIAKHGLKSIDEVVNTAKITSLLELKRIGISSVDDLMTLGVTTAKDLPKLGIRTMKDLAELGIKSADDLAKLDIKNVDDFVEAGLGTLDDANRVFKEASGADEVAKTIPKSNPNNINVQTGQQDKHIPGTNNYNQEIAKGKYRSTLTENPQQLLDDFAGTGQKIGYAGDNNIVICPYSIK